LGLDVHYQQVTVAMQEDGGRLKAAGKMGHVDFLNWVPTAAAVRAQGKGLLCAQGTKSAADGGRVTCG